MKPSLDYLAWTVWETVQPYMANSPWGRNGKGEKQPGLGTGELVWGAGNSPRRTFDAWVGRLLSFEAQNLDWSLLSPISHRTPR